MDDVSPCLDISADVKRDMIKLLKEYQRKKETKRISRDLEDKLTRSSTIMIMLMTRRRNS